MDKWIKIDERTEHVSGKLSFIFLGLTQAGLLTAIFSQRYIMGRPPIYYNDLLFVFCGSVILYWLTSLYLGGVMPILSTRSIVGSYLILVLMIAVPYILIRGFPTRNGWLHWSLVILIGPAVLIGGYTLAASLGRQRLNRLSS